ncbi:MAG: 4Fe-4S binding protein [Proteobacteria bacterium]|nr:4Fe-4S binding protein [Pseudomonadota bacterium]
MPDLKIKIKDVVLKNPLIIASGTPTYGLSMVKKCIRSEAAAFVTKTLCYTEWLRKQPRPRWHIEHPEAIDDGGYFSLYSTERLNPTPPEEYVKKMKGYAQEAHDLCGATAVQTCAAVIVFGHKIIKRWLRQISGWMEAKGYHSLADFSGRSVSKIIAPSQIPGDVPYVSRIDPDACQKCLRCLEACPYEAISVVEKKLVVDPEKCDGCRLCVALCQQGAAEFNQK